MTNLLIITCFLLLIYIILSDNKKKKITVLRIIKNKKQRRLKMNEIIKQFENKDCLVYTMNSQITGVISKIGEGWIEITGEKEKSVVNTDYIIRIREYPKDKRGKKKSVVLD